MHSCRSSSAASKRRAKSIHRSCIDTPPPPTSTAVRIGVDVEKERWGKGGEGGFASTPLAGKEKRKRRKKKGDGVRESECLFVCGGQGWMERERAFKGNKKASAKKGFIDFFFLFSQAHFTFFLPSFLLCRSRFLHFWQKPLHFILPHPPISIHIHQSTDPRNHLITPAPPSMDTPSLVLAPTASTLASTH